MKGFFLITLPMAIAGLLSAQCSTSHASENSSIGTNYSVEQDHDGSDDLVTKTLTIPTNYSAVKVSMGAKVYYTVGTTGAVEIVGTDYLVDRTVVEVENNTLRVRIDKDDDSEESRNHWRGDLGNELKVFVTGPVFSSVDVSVGGVVNMRSDMSVNGTFVVRGNSGGIFQSKHVVGCDEFDCDVNSGTIVNLSDLQTGKADVDGSAGAIITLKGNVKTLDADFSAGTIATISGLTLGGGSVTATSGSILTIGSNRNKVELSKSSGAMVN